MMGDARLHACAREAAKHQLRSQHVAVYTAGATLLTSQMPHQGFSSYRQPMTTAGGVLRSSRVYNIARLLLANAWHQSTVLGASVLCT